MLTRLTWPKPQVIYSFAARRWRRSRSSNFRDHSVFGKLRANFESGRRVVVLMARMNDSQREALDAVRREIWSLRGPNQVVKVLPARGAVSSMLGGYITLGKFLLNKTPAQIETALGLPPGHLAAGARIYRFTRLPQASECEYELTAEFPDGLAYNPAYSDPSYPPGSRIIHQWKIRPGVHIPVDSRNFLDLKPGQSFRYAWLV